MMHEERSEILQLQFASKGTSKKFQQRTQRILQPYKANAAPWIHLRTWLRSHGHQHVEYQSQIRWRREEERAYLLERVRSWTPRGSAMSYRIRISPGVHPAKISIKSPSCQSNKDPSRNCPNPRNAFSSVEAS